VLARLDTTNNYLLFTILNRTVTPVSHLQSDNSPVFQPETIMTQRTAWLARLAIMSSLLAAGSVHAADVPPPPTPPQDMQGANCMPPPKMDQAHRMALLGAELKLQAKQQPAWDAFLQAQQQVHQGMMPPPPQNAANAVERIKQHAAHAAEKARQLQQFSKATQQLWAVLDNKQRALFDHMMQAPGPMHMPPSPRPDGGHGRADMPPPPMGHN
jgi:hypothetical protein